MVRAGQIIAHRLGAVRAQEDGTGMANVGKEGLGIGNHQLQMLWCKGVGEFRCLLQVLRFHHQPPVHQGLPGRALPGVAGQLLRETIGQLPDQPVAGGEQDGGSHGIVLGLGQEVCSKDPGLCRVVGNHQHFAGACQGIDGNLSINGLLRQRHVDVARTANHVDRRDGFSAVGKCGNGLGAAHPVHGIHPG